MERAEIQSRMILGARPSPETLAEITAQLKPNADVVGFCVFETKVGHKTVYCCWSGGGLDKEGKPELTLVGRAAFEALCSLPDAMPDANPTCMIFAEVKIGITPLQWKVKKIILDAPVGAYICFVGDLAKELDGHMGRAFNLTGEPIFLPIAEGLKP